MIDITLAEGNACACDPPTDPLTTHWVVTFH